MCEISINQFFNTLIYVVVLEIQNKRSTIVKVYWVYNFTLWYKNI